MTKKEYLIIEKKVKPNVKLPKKTKKMIHEDNMRWLEINGLIAAEVERRAQYYTRTNMN